MPGSFTSSTILEEESVLRESDCASGQCSAEAHLLLASRGVWCLADWSYVSECATLSIFCMTLDINFQIYEPLAVST